MNMFTAARHQRQLFIGIFFVCVTVFSRGDICFPFVFFFRFCICHVLEASSTPPLALSESSGGLILCSHIDLSWISTDIILRGQANKVCKNYEPLTWTCAGVWGSSCAATLELNSAGDIIFINRVVSPLGSMNICRRNMELLQLLFKIPLSWREELFPKKWGLTTSPLPRCTGPPVRFCIDLKFDFSLLRPLRSYSSDLINWYLPSRPLRSTEIYCIGFIFLFCSCSFDSYFICFIWFYFFFL